ncbi:MAG: hypothetical protein K0S65_5709, partial [Labilithrix sp.]|nr:hypothetical protein [Labilithrix sp.]
MMQGTVVVLRERDRGLSTQPRHDLASGV